PLVAGHKGQINLGDMAGRPVLAFTGRLHFYEGHPWERVVRPIEVAAELGAGILVLTNASGGIAEALEPGSLLALTDHIEWNQPFAWQSDIPPSPPLRGRGAEGAAAALPATGDSGAAPALDHPRRGAAAWRLPAVAARRLLPVPFRQPVHRLQEFDLKIEVKVTNSFKIRRRRTTGTGKVLYLGDSFGNFGDSYTPLVNGHMILKAIR